MDVCPIRCIVLPGTSAAALHLVGDVNRIVAVAQRTDFAQELAARDTDAANALNRLDDHGRYFVIFKRFLQSGLVVQRNEDHVVGTVDRSDDIRIVGSSHRKRRTAVKGAFHRDHLAFSVMERRQFQGVFVRLGSRIAQEKLVIPLAGKFAQLISQLALLVDNYRIRIESDMLQLVYDRIHIVRMRVPDRNYGMSAVHIQITGSFIVPDVRALGAYDIDIPQGVHFEQIHIFRFFE